MSDGMTLVHNEDGSFSAYDDTYDMERDCKKEANAIWKESDKR